MTTRLIKQSQMTGECWLIQMSGPSACDTCEAKGTRDCGGKKIRKSGKNEKGVSVPLGTEVKS